MFWQYPAFGRGIFQLWITQFIQIILFNGSPLKGLHFENANMVTTILFRNRKQIERQVPTYVSTTFFCNDTKIKVDAEAMKGEKGQRDQLGQQIEPDENPLISFVAFYDELGSEYCEFDFPVLLIEMLIDLLIEKAFGL